MKLETIIQLFNENHLKENHIRYNIPSDRLELFIQWLIDNEEDLNGRNLQSNQIQVLRICRMGLCGCCKNIIHFDDVIDDDNTYWYRNPCWNHLVSLYNHDIEKYVLDYNEDNGRMTLRTENSRREQVDCDDCIEQRQKQRRKIQLLNQMSKSRCKAPSDCPICMEEIELDTHQMQLKCKHTFHPACITRWAEKQPSCPNCRRDIIKSAV